MVMTMIHSSDSDYGTHDIQDAQLSQRDRAAVCVMVLANGGRPELGDNILRTWVYLQPM